VPLNTFKVKPGFDKQNTEAGAVARWVSGDNVRFRYGLPQKVGGWKALGSTTLNAVSRKLYSFRDNIGGNYLAIGMDKFLLIYYEGSYYDITPYRTSGYPAVIDSFASSTFTTASGTPDVTITTTSNHLLNPGDIVELTSVASVPGGYSDSDFEGKLFEVKTVPTITTFTIEAASNAGSTASGGTCTVKPLETIGPQIQSLIYGWGTGVFGGSSPSVAWGLAASSAGVTAEPGIWSLSSYGQVLVATVLNGKTFTWDPGAANAFGRRASINTTGFETTSNPTASRLTMVSPTTRHLIHLGTETTLGSALSQDDMFIRFSSQEELNNYTITAGNSAGSQRLQDGSRIMGTIKSKEAILIWTDNALYIMRHIGAPFVFGFEQVGTNCGLVGQNAVAEVDGIAYWFSGKGFFKYDGSVKTLDCMVEDYVYDDIDLTQGQQIYAGVNNLYTEVRWDYPSGSADYNDRYVVYNFAESAQIPGGVWYTGSTARTSWIDANVYDKPFGSSFNSATNGSFPAVLGETAAPNGYGNTTIFEHEEGTDQVNSDGSTTALTSNIESFDFDITSPELGNGEYFVAMRRFIPDFRNITGNATVTLNLKDYPSQSQTASTYSPFTITSATTKVDTRARGRFISIKIANTAAAQTWRFGTLRIDIQPDGRR
tara:strand:+ start:4811 stop:6778 length:1968 start_codon:yes stop_codon:yes gene_type:complete